MERLPILVLSLYLLLPSPTAASVAVPSPDEVMAVPAELRERLSQFVHQGGSAPKARLEQLVDFMFAEHGLALRYDDDVTRTVAETYAAGRGNCLSFTLTFIALAREAGLHAFVQEFDRALVWYRHDDMIFHTTHVNAGVRIVRDQYTIDFDRTVRTTRKRPKVVSDERALAHFYNNRGAERMAAGDLVGARELFDRAIASDTSYPAVWNNLGVWFARTGDDVSAVASYGHALELDAEHTSALSNLAALHRTLGDPEAAVEMETRLERVRRYDPFHHFVLAMKYEMRGQLPEAADNYRRAIRLHPTDHEFHFGLGRVLYALGDHRGAAQALMRAESHADALSRGTYRAKLEALRAEAGHAPRRDPRERFSRSCVLIAADCI